MRIINGILHTMAGVVYENGYVDVINGKIADLGAMADLPEPVAGEEVLDVQGAFVMPGIIEAHCHVGMIEEKRGQAGDDCNDATSPLTPGLRAVDGINPMDPAFHDALAAGITAVMTGPGSANVVGGQFALLKTYGRSVDEMLVKAPAAMKAALGENPKAAYGQQGKMPSTRMGSAWLLRKCLAEATEYKKQRGKHEIPKDLSQEAWMPVLKKEIPLKVHAHRADDILTAVRIAREFDIRLTIDHCTEGHLIAKELKASGHPAIVGPALTARSKIEVQYLNFKTAGILDKEGILVAITTDHPVSLIQYLPLCAGLAVKAGLSMEAGLHAITRNPAVICGVEERMGTLEIGKDADLAIFTDNPMKIFTKTLYTMIDGKIVFSDGKIH